MLLNHLTFSVLDVTPGYFSIFSLWAYLMLLQDVFQSFDFERTWCYSRMFFNLLTLSVPDVTPGCFSICWLWAYLMLLQDIFSIFWHWAYLMLIQDVFQSFDFERTWRYSRMFFIFLTLSVPDVTPGCFFNLLNLSVPDVIPGCFWIYWLWAYLMLF